MKNLICIDIQPEYIKGFSFFLEDWVKMINKSRSKTIFLYNGWETLGMIKEQDYKYWLFQIGVSGKKIANSTFFDKGYAFFRDAMDAQEDEKDIINLVQHMNKYKINDSRDLPEEKLLSSLKNEKGSIHLPSLIDFDFPKNPILCGGGREECLKEVEILLKSLEIPYQLLQKFIY